MAASSRYECSYREAVAIGTRKGAYLAASSQGECSYRAGSANGRRGDGCWQQTPRVSTFPGPPMVPPVASPKWQDIILPTIMVTRSRKYTRGDSCSHRGPSVEHSSQPMSPHSPGRCSSPQLYIPLTLYGIRRLKKPVSRSIRKPTFISWLSHCSHPRQKRIFRPQIENTLLSTLQRQNEPSQGTEGAISTNPRPVCDAWA